MKVLLIGSGAREHAMGWQLRQSPKVSELYSLPGNPGLARVGHLVEGINLSDVGAIAAMARIEKIDLAVVGPEGPLADGVVDALTGVGIRAFGPSRAAARLEASKAFAKDVMSRAGVPTAESEAPPNRKAADYYLKTNEPPYVVKANGLAAGKGVLVTDSRKEAMDWVHRCFDGEFGDSDPPVLLEEYMPGSEISVFAVCTDQGAYPFEPARDYKRLNDGDDGPNTGGMGSYSPVTDLPDNFVDGVMDELIRPTLHQMEEDGNPFRGFLYAGLVQTITGPKVLEFNVRLGDPEAQAVLPRLANDFVEVLEGAEPEFSTLAAVNVVLAARGYPEDPVMGAQIKGLRDVRDDVLIFHAGTAYDGKRLVVNGGRVLSVVGVGDDLTEARDDAYRAAECISWPGMQIRTDIAQD